LRKNIKARIFVLSNNRKLIAMKNVRQQIEDLRSRLVSAGCPDDHMEASHSKTTWGYSSYLLVGANPTQPDIKIRCSDHSCGTQRVLSEIHLTNDEQQVFELVERYFFPERYTAVQSMEWRETYKSDKALGNLTAPYEVISSTPTKRGGFEYRVRVQDVPVFSYIRK